jgi:hypothetical protein
MKAMGLAVDQRDGLRNIPIPPTTPAWGWVKSPGFANGRDYLQNSPLSFVPFV